ncbi:MAG TPA: hypothetical protein V6C95_10210 [Coleofasciculaceae cyanobacterium]
MTYTFALSNSSQSPAPLDILGDFYQQLKTIPNTTISLQYNCDKFLSFKVYEATQGRIINQGFDENDVTIRCQIRDTTYTFTHEHLSQLSNRERHDLFKQLGI